MLKRIGYFLLLVCLLTSGFSYHIPKAKASGPALVQTKSCDGCSTLAFDSSVTAGDAIIVSYRCGGAAVTPSFTDTLGDSFSEADHGDNAADGNTRLSISYALNTGGGADTLTPSGIGSCSNRWAIAEYSGINHSGALDQHVGNSFGNVSSFTTSNITTTQPSEVLICAVEHSESNDWRTQSPFASEVFDTKIDIGDRIVSSTGTYNCGLAGTADPAGGSTVLASFIAPNVWTPLTSGINNNGCDFGTHDTAVSATAGAVNVGDVIFVDVNYDIGPSTGTVVSDNLGNTYTKVATESDVGSGQNVDLWVSFVTHAGTPTATVQFTPTPGSTTSVCVSLIVDPFSGSDTSSSMDGSSGNLQIGPGTGTDAVTSNTYSTTKDGDLVYTTTGIPNDIGPAAATAGTGQTGLTSVIGADATLIQSEYLVQSAHSGSTVGTWTASNGTDVYGTISVSITPAGTGGEWVHTSGTSTLAQDDASTATQEVATAGASVAVGDLVIVTSTWDNGAGASSDVITDNLGNTYNRVTASAASFSSQNQVLWYSVITHAGTPVVTQKFNPSPGTTVAAFSGIDVDTFTGSSASSALDGSTAQSQANPTTATDALTSGSFSTSQNGDLIFSGTTDYSTGGNPGSQGTGFSHATDGGGGGSIFLKSEYKTQTLNGSVAGTWTAAVDDAHITSAMAISPNGAGGGGGSSGLPKFNIFQGVVSILKGIFFIR